MTKIPSEIALSGLVFELVDIAPMLYVLLLKETKLVVVLTWH